MRTGDVIGIAVLVTLLPAFVGYLVWLLRVRPRRYVRAQLARAEEVGRSLGLAAVEPGLARGTRAGVTVEVAFGVSSTPYARGGRPITTCRAWLANPFAISFAVATPRRYAAGATQRWERDVWIGGPNPEALELAASLAPRVEAQARATHGMLAVELDRATSSVILDGTVVDPSRLERALTIATDLATTLDRR